MKKLIVLGILLALVVGVYGWTECMPIIPPIVQNQEQVQTQWQSVSQENYQNVVVNPATKTLDVGTVQLYSRLVYPGEVITVPIKLGDLCSVMSASPVALYTITPERGLGSDMVQTSEAQPTYDPIRHQMEFGYVPIVDKIDYWTEKAYLRSTVDGLCVLDNRAPGNGYVTVELSVYPRGK